MPPSSASSSSLSAALSAAAATASSSFSSKSGPPVRKRARLDSAGAASATATVSASAGGKARKAIDETTSEPAIPRSLPLLSPTPTPPTSTPVNLEQYRLHDMPGAEVYHLPNIVPLEEARAWYDALSGLETWYQPTLKIYGREVVQSRKVAAYTTSPTLTLKYSGQLVTMHRSYPPLLREIQERVEKVAGVEFNHVMLNLYEDGGVYIGRHRDNLENRVIASLSLGAPRTFVMSRDMKARERAGGRGNRKGKGIGNRKGKGRNKRSKPDSAEDDEDDEGDEEANNQPDAQTQTRKEGGVDKKTIVLQPGSLVIMQGETQRWWKHEIPREPKVKEGRISLTFRQLEQA